MENNKIRKVIREVIEENSELLNEITYEPLQPKYHEFFESHHQYIFKTKNDNDYVLSIKNSCLFISEKDIINSYPDKDEDKSCYDFLMINFFPYQKDPNSEDTFDEKTNNNEMFLLLKNILWLLDDYIINHPNEKYFAFSAENQRMNIYQDAFNNFSKKFTIYPPKKYDKSYKYDLIIMIKK